MAPRITLISGCSSGIGLATAVALAQAKGYVVYATMRNLAKKDNLVKAAGGALDKTLFITQLDVTKEDSITGAVKTIIDRHGRIDILINNAGHGGGGLIEHTSMDSIRSMYDINVFGLIRLTQEVIPHMKKQRSGRIISISSVVGITAWPFTESYSSTKFAVEGFSESLCMSLRPFNIWVSTVQPGPVSTAFSANMGESNNQPNAMKQMQDPDIDPESRQVLGKTFKYLTSGRPNKTQTPEEIAAVLRGALEADKPHLRYPTSDFRRDFANQFVKDPTGDTYINTILPHMSDDTSKK